MFDVVIINDDLERAYTELKDILSEVGKMPLYLYNCCQTAAVLILLYSLDPKLKSKKKKSFPPLSLFIGNPKSSGGQIIRGEPCISAAGQGNQYLWRIQTRERFLWPSVLNDQRCSNRKERHRTETLLYSTERTGVKVKFSKTNSQYVGVKIHFFQVALAQSLVWCTHQYHWYRHSTGLC